MDSNIEVHEHLHTYIRYWDVSISFTDRIFFVVVKEGKFSGRDYVVDYLTNNGFNHQSHGIYTRFKNRKGDFVSQDIFDGENNHGVREEMVNRVKERICQD